MRKILLLCGLFFIFWGCGSEINYFYHLQLFSEKKTKLYVKSMGHDRLLKMVTRLYEKKGAQERNINIAWVHDRFPSLYFIHLYEWSKSIESDIKNSFLIFDNSKKDKPILLRGFAKGFCEISVKKLNFSKKKRILNNAKDFFLVEYTSRIRSTLYPKMKVVEEKTFYKGYLFFRKNKNGISLVFNTGFLAEKNKYYGFSKMLVGSKWRFIDYTFQNVRNQLVFIVNRKFFIVKEPFMGKKFFKNADVEKKLGRWIVK